MEVQPLSVKRRSTEVGAQMVVNFASPSNATPGAAAEDENGTGVVTPDEQKDSQAAVVVHGLRCSPRQRRWMSKAATVRGANLRTWKPLL